MATFELSYDYLCPFAKNIHLHVVTALRAGAPFSVTFVPWSLNQSHRPEGTPNVWENPEYDDRLAALAASVSVRDRQPAHFLNAHEALFLARHERGLSLKGLDEVLSVLAPLGVDVDDVATDVASRRPHQVLGAAHEHFGTVEAFGVPTFLYHGDATFVRYMTPPKDPAHSIDLITRLLDMMGEPELNEFKHTRIPH